MADTLTQIARKAEMFRFIEFGGKQNSLKWAFVAMSHSSNTNDAWRIVAQAFHSDIRLIDSLY